MYIQGNPLLFWTGLLTILWTISSFIIWLLNWFQLSIEASQITNKKALTALQTKFKKLKMLNQDLPTLIFILVAYASPWILWSFSPRIMFFYHYTPAVPLMSILVSYWLIKLAKTTVRGKYVSILAVAAIALCFFLFYPNWTAIAVDKAWSKLYFALSSWQ